MFEEDIVNLDEITPSSSLLDIMKSGFHITLYKGDGLLYTLRRHVGIIRAFIVVESSHLGEVKSSHPFPFTHTGLQDATDLINTWIGE